MSERLARAVMLIAAHCLGQHRREWAWAMQSEFEASVDAGEPLAFAGGCLAAALRDMPTHAEGRFRIGSYLVVLALIVPFAAVLVGSVLAGFPGSYLEEAGAPGMLQVGGAPLLTEGNLSAVPSLAALVVLLAALNLRLGWLVLDRDWPRVAVSGALIAAATATLTIFNAVVFADYGAALPQVLVLTIELLAVSALARRHAELGF